MDRKRKRASSSVRIRDKVCIFCRTGNEIEIFVVDLSCDGVGDGMEPSLRSPTLRITAASFDRWAFCVLGSTLYAFEGSGDPLRKSIFRFPLPHNEANLKLEKCMLVETAKMHSNKVYPAAVSTPDGNILVFSSLVQRGDRCTFELYNTSSQVCIKLPEIHSDWLPDISFRARTFTFISRTVFFIEMNFAEKSAFDSGMFTLDLGASTRNKQWKKLNNFFGGMPPRTSYVVKDTQLCMIPLKAYYIGDLARVGKGRGRGRVGRGRGGGDDPDVLHNAYDVFSRCSYPYPRIPRMPSSLPPFRAKAITLMGESGDSGFRFCILEIGLNPDSMILNEYHCNLFKCSRKLIQNREKDKGDWSADQKMPLPYSTMVRSVKFFYHPKSDAFCPYSFYSI